ncbi:TPA: Arc family DNA-binding protein [Salmonella enterica]|uniref:Arc family DNA-binding protein n=1 Tax=Salmonella enterica TaxID=28901 RepID=A0A765BPY7_SALER|nr:Arc family DNA-binding protein [Salmonella enterica]UMY45063.1 Arc family DNA-binding protein [Salmonella enterica]HAG1882576.1 Arc family DNA-binding protein [Salmonella enterica]HAG5358530.1 Arc family DNA-binding protein [Salmonella enterica]
MSKRDPQFNLRIPADIKEQITALAAKNKRSINTEIVAAIELSLEVNSGAIKPTDSGLPGGLGHLLKTLKPAELEKFVNDISTSAAERAIKKLTQKKD